jgi:aromatic ring-opening dioxygenase LigB subunit
MPVTGAFILPHPPIILPEVGRGEEKKIQKTIDSFREIAGRIRDLKPETIVLTSPHSILYADYFHISPGEGARGTFGQFRAPDVVISAAYDTEFVLALERRAAAVRIPAGTLGERDPALDHGTMIPLAFIIEVYTDYKLVRLGLSGLPLADHYRLGLCIAEVADALCRRVVFVASGDLSTR